MRHCAYCDQVLWWWQLTIDGHHGTCAIAYTRGRRHGIRDVRLVLAQHGLVPAAREAGGPAAPDLPDVVPDWGRR